MKDDVGRASPASSGERLPAGEAIDAETMAAFVEGTLTAAENEAVALALRSNPDLRRDYEEVRALLPVATEQVIVRRGRGLRIALVTAASLLLCIWIGVGWMRTESGVFLVAEKGRVVVCVGAYRTDGDRRIEMGETLDAGDRVRIETGGALVQLCEDRLKAGREIATPGGRPPDDRVRRVVDAFQASLDQRSKRLVDFERRKGREGRTQRMPCLRLPAGETVKRRPKFVWSGEVERNLVFTLSCDDEVSFRVEVPAGVTHLEFPKGERSLEPGRQYVWRLAELGPEKLAAELPFYVWSDEECRELDRISDEVFTWVGDRLGRDLLLVSFLRESNLIGASIDLLRSMRNEVGDNEFLRGELIFCEELTRVQ